MATYEETVKKLEAIATRFANTVKVADAYDKKSTDDIRVLIAKVAKNRARLAEDAKAAKERLDQFKQDYEKVAHLKKQLEIVTKAKEDSPELDKWGGPRSAIPAIAVDKKKPLKPQIIAGIKEMIEKRTQAVEQVLVKQQRAVEEWTKHQEKHKRAVDILKSLTEDL